MEATRFLLCYGNFDYLENWEHTEHTVSNKTPLFFWGCVCPSVSTPSCPSLSFLDLFFHKAYSINCQFLILLQITVVYKAVSKGWNGFEKGVIFWRAFQLFFLFFSRLYWNGSCVIFRCSGSVFCFQPAITLFLFS